MSEQAVVLGLAMTAFIFAYYAFELRDSPVENNQRVAIFLAFVSLAFTNLLFYTTYQIAQNSASYLTGGFLETGLLVMIWATNLILVYILLATIWTVGKWFIETVPNYLKGSEKE